MLLEALDFAGTRKGAHKSAKWHHGINDVLFLNDSEVKELIKSLVEVVQYFRQIPARLLTGHGVFQALLSCKSPFFLFFHINKIEHSPLRRNQLKP